MNLNNNGVKEERLVDLTYVHRRQSFKKYIVPLIKDVFAGQEPEVHTEAGFVDESGHMDSNRSR